MGEKRYMISDASKMMGVEAHVLRYWEEELNITIPRNEMGHRYYTDNHINLLKNVRDLKNQGYSLRTIKMMLTDPDDNKNRQEPVLMPLTATPVGVGSMSREIHQNGCGAGSITVNSGAVVADVNEPNTKMEQFQAIMDKVVCKALKNNASELGKEVSNNVSNTVLKEMNYLIRTQDEREEERYKKLDETMRSKLHMSKKEKKKKVKAEKLLLKKSKKENEKQTKNKKPSKVHIGKNVVTG
jgi:DNA-binding transcriptional MerR regulator